MGVVHLVATMVVGPLSAAVPIASHSASPAYAGDFPDPFVLDAGGAYWVYSTGSGGRNLQVMTLADLQHWGPPLGPRSRWLRPPPPPHHSAGGLEPPPAECPRPGA